MKDEYLKRTKGLLGEENYNSYKTKRIAVFGLGGVGGTAVESLARLGFNNLLLVDFDKVDPTNLNRQILYKESDIGKIKTEAAKRHLLELDNSINIETLNIKVDRDIENELKKYEIDFIVDAIDDVSAKVMLSKYAQDNNIPSIVSLGMANRLDPSQVRIMKLDKTTHDPLAKKVRYEFKNAGIDTKQVNAVISLEEPKKDGVNLNSIITVPSSAGLSIAFFVISYFNNKNK